MTKSLGRIVITAGLLIFTTGASQARTTANSRDGKPNILVVMTDDQAVSDLQAMPNLQSLVAHGGVTFANTVDSFPLCCPSRATFITGQYSHNHGVGGNFWPYGWYGMTGRDNTLPVWLHNAGYYTALVGKWLNGYGAGNQPGSKKPGDPVDVDVNGKPLIANGEIPAGFDNWNGAIDVSAYDYFNLSMNQNGRVRFWGDPSYAKKLNTFAEIQVSPGIKNRSQLIAYSNKIFGPYTSPDPSTYGTQVAANYSPDVTAGVSDSILRSQAQSKKPFFLWWSPSSPHREDVNGGVRNGYRDNAHYYAQSSNKHKEDLNHLVPDPRPAPRYANKTWNWTTITNKPSFDAQPTGKPVAQQTLMANPLTSLKKKQLQNNYNGRLGAVKAVDDGIKKLINTLQATHQWDNTLIVFTSDNGWLQGEHRVPGDKYLPYEESIRVPFIIKGPGISKGKTINTLVSNIDFAPTLVEAAKARAGRTQDGVSLLSAARNLSTTPAYNISLEANAPLFGDASMPQQWDQPYRGVRTARWKYVSWCYKNDPILQPNNQTCIPTGETELYDLQADPYELNNLTNNPSYSSQKTQLQNELAALQSCVGANCRRTSIN